eukprot:m.39541 g.39541  ORF g.39541 m.39541 type:complete len:232 (-) comp12681_c0_seq2:260-955(-)
MDVELACDTEGANSLHNVVLAEGELHIVHCRGQMVDGAFRYCVSVTDAKNIAFYKAFKLSVLDSQRRAAALSDWSVFFRAIKASFVQESVTLNYRDDGSLDVAVPVRSTELRWSMVMCGDGQTRDVIAQVCLDLAKGKSSPSYLKLLEEHDQLQRQQRMQAAGLGQTIPSLGSESMTLSQSLSPVKESKRSSSSTASQAAAKKPKAATNLLHPGASRRKKQALQFDEDDSD